jgi:hypothetical protein
MQMMFYSSIKVCPLGWDNINGKFIPNHDEVSGSCETQPENYCLSRMTRGCNPGYLWRKLLPPRFVRGNSPEGRSLMILQPPDLFHRRLLAELF